MYTWKEVNIALLRALLHQVKTGQDTEFWQTRRVVCIQDRREHSKYIFSRDLLFQKEYVKTSIWERDLLEDTV